ncbi:MAG TPA: hemin uptake protein HemP [Fimbriiglobus sp.]|nr:hemin uptake protein HemP [Fimbriiglobus sp.]
MTDDQESDDTQNAPQPGEPAVVIPAEQIFGERREVWIEHNGERYRLRITRRGKLILQK